MGRIADAALDADLQADGGLGEAALPVADAADFGCPDADDGIGEAALPGEARADAGFGEPATQSPAPPQPTGCTELDPGRDGAPTALTGERGAEQ